MAGTSYTRQSSFSDGDTISASLFNNEYNKIVNAFSYASSGTTGHRHDGTSGEGGNIHTIGDQDFLNKIVVDSTNNRWGFFVQVSSSAVEQVRVQDGAIVPVTDNDIDLGTSSLEFKDGYFDGTVYADAINFNGTAITATAAELNILDGVTSTASELNILDGVTATAAELNYSDTGSSVGTVVASKVVTVDSNKDVASFRNITLTGELDAGSLDVSGDADIDGTLETDALSINGTTVTSTAAELNILDGVTATAAELNYSDTGQSVGTVVASKVVTVDSNKDVSSFRNITLTGELDAGSLDISGDADIDGTLETDALSINGTAVTSTAAELNILDGVTSTAAELNILDGVTATTAELNILDGVTSTAAELNILDGVTATTAELNILDGVTVTAAEINTLDGITAVLGELNALDLGSTAVGTAIASKAVILDANKDYTGIRNFTITGELDAATLDISGDVDIDGTTNLDVVDIDGAVDMASTLAVGGVVTANAGVVVDNITIDGTEIDLSSGDLTVDVAGDIILDAAGDNILIKDAGTHYANITMSSNNLLLDAVISDGDLLFRGNDGGSTITALTLDMSAAGKATFNSHIALGDSKQVQLGADADFIMYHDGTSNYVQAAKQDSDIIFRGNDGGSGVNMLTLDTSAAGEATFNAGINGTTATFTTADNLTQVRLISTDDDGSIGPRLDFFRNSASPTAGDFTGRMRFLAEDSAGNETAYVHFDTLIDDPTDGSEDGQLRIETKLDGNMVERIGIDSTETVINEDSRDLDFRIESDSATHAFFLQGSSGNVGIGTSAPAYALDVDSTIHIGNDGGSSFSHSRLIFDANGAGRAAGNFFHNQADDVEYFAGSPYNKSDSFAICRNATASHADGTSNITNALVVVDSAGNLHVGGSTTPTSSAGNLILNNGTAPAGSATNGVVLYAEDVSSSSELKVRDEAGNVTTLSPHNFSLIPEGPSEDMAWSYFSERDGKQINIDMLKAIRVLEKISGEQLVFEN